MTLISLTTNNKMDIKIHREKKIALHPFELFANQKLQSCFVAFPFLYSVQIYLRGNKHLTKKVKLQARVKGKNIFASAEGPNHHDAFEKAYIKLFNQCQRFKTEKYKAA